MTHDDWVLQGTIPWTGERRWPIGGRNSEAEGMGCRLDTTGETDAEETNHRLSLTRILKIAAGDR